MFTYTLIHCGPPNRPSNIKVEKVQAWSARAAMRPYIARMLTQDEIKAVKGSNPRR